MANEKRLIDANALNRKKKYSFQTVGGCFPKSEWFIKADDLFSAPTVDAVEVVRCKDCKWYKEGKYLAPNKFCYRLKDRSGEHIGYNFSDDDFCSYGERKDNG